MPNIEAIYSQVAFVLLGAVTAIVLLLLALAWRNPVMLKMGLRNIPRRPAQSILIVIGLTLSTIIIVASLSTGDTLNYSVQRQAVAAYGEIDEIIAPPLLSLLASLGQDTEADRASETSDQLSGLFEGGLTSVLTVLEGGLPGISMERLAQLKTDAEKEPLIDGVAGSILFPTIVRNVSTGQGEPLGFVFAVDDDYDQTFGITSIDGRKLEIESLNAGVGNIFVQASSLFSFAAAQGQRLGLNLSPSSVATAVAAIGSVLAGVQGNDLSGLQIDLATLEEMGIDTQPLKEMGLESIPVGELVAAVPGLSELMGSTGAVTATVPMEEAGELELSAAPELTATSALTAGAAVTESVVATGATESAPGLAGILARGGDLLSALNLNTLGTEVDRVLGQVGLQLKQGDVYLNRLGAEALGAQTGDVLEIFVGPIPTPFRVKAIVEEASPLGALFPVAIMQLSEAQKLFFMNGKVNNVLVSNQGDMLEGVKQTAAVSSKLRELAMDPVVLEQAVEVLRRPAVKAAIEREAGKGTAALIGEDVPPFLANLISSFGTIGETLIAIEGLPAALSEPGVGPSLRAALASGELRMWVLDLELPPDAKQDLANAFAELNKFDLVQPLSKETVLLAADFGGAAFSSLFSVFGFFSVLAGILLIFLIFVMLAAERRSEMGISRAIGVQRGHLVQMYTSEGMVYSLVAAGLGVLIGLLVSFAMIEYLGSILNNLAGQVSNSTAGILSFQFRASPQSIIISYCLGVLLTFAVVTISSWRVSRLNIVAAIRDLPDETNASRQGMASRLGGWLWPIGMVALGGVVLFYGFRWSAWSLALIGATVGVFGVVFVLERVLEAFGVQGQTAQRIAYTVIGLVLLLLWVTPWQTVLPRLGLEKFANDPTQILAVFAIGGPMIIMGAIMVIMVNAQAFTWLVERLFGWIGFLTPVLKTAIAYPLSTRFRTGMAMVLFAMVMATVVVMSMVIQATESLVVLGERESGGFDVQTSNTLLSFFDPLVDLEAEIGRAVETYPALAGIERVGSVKTQVFDGLQEGVAGAAGRVNFAGLSEGYIEQAATVYALSKRAAGFADDAAVWEALRTRDDVVLMRHSMAAKDGATPDAASFEPTPTPEIIMGMTIEPDPDEFDFRPLRLYGIPEEGELMPETFVTLVFDDGEVRREKRVQVIGMLERGAMLTDVPLMGNIRIGDTLLGERARPETHYVKVKSGFDEHEVAQEVERAFLSNGINAVVMSERFAQGQVFTRNILRLLQGFMALGLLVGIAGLGVITTRTVVERRQQVGMLRAVGYQSNMVALSFVLEASFVALTGLVIGAATGIVLGMSIVRVSFANMAEFQIPWGSIVLIMALAYGLSLLTTIVPAWQASRIYPAEALRYE